MTCRIVLEPGKSTVAFIGLGIMGMPMAKNLIDAGYTVQCYDRRLEAAEEIAGEGGVCSPSIEQCIQDADVTITMLPDTADVEDVILSPSGLLACLPEGHLVIDMSTIAPLPTQEMGRALADKGVYMLDAPVSGGQVGAVEGTLSIMVGGDEDVFEAALPLFKIMGKNVVHMGPLGTGQITKACNQIVVGVTIQAVSEALTLADRAGADMSKVREALLGGFAQSRILELHGQRIIDGNFAPGFKVRLHHKDLRIALDTGRAVGAPMMATALVNELLGALKATGQGDLDHSSLGLLMKNLSGQE